MSLADSWDGGGNYLGAGWHKVHITGLRPFEYTNGNAGIEFEVQDSQGAKNTVSFSLKEDPPGKIAPACNNRLAWWAKTCGLTREEGAQYEPLRASSHSVLMRKGVQVLLELQKDSDKYYEVTAWREFDAEELPYQPPVQAQAPLPPVAADVPEKSPNDGIPF